MLPNRSCPDENPTTASTQMPNPIVLGRTLPLATESVVLQAASSSRRFTGGRDCNVASCVALFPSGGAGVNIMSMLQSQLAQSAPGAAGGRHCMQAMHMPHNMVSTFLGGQPFKKQVGVPKTSKQFWVILQLNASRSHARAPSPPRQKLTSHMEPRQPHP